MKILVTGTAGFIGFHLAKTLLNRGDEVIGIDNINDYYDVELKYARLAETGILRDDIVYNTSVQSSKYPNYQFVKLDLADCYNLEQLFTTKKSNELMAHTYSHLFGIPTTGLRFFTVYGPYGRPDMALFLFTKAILAGVPIQVFNNGEMKRDFTYVDDIVSGIIRVLDHPPLRSGKRVNDPSVSETAPYKVYNIGNSSPVRLMDFIEAIESKLGISATKELLPMQAGDVPMTWADTSDLERDLGYKPNTPIKEGVGRFI